MDYRIEYGKDEIKVVNVDKNEIVYYYERKYIEIVEEHFTKLNDPLDNVDEQEFRILMSEHIELFEQSQKINEILGMLYIEDIMNKQVECVVQDNKLKYEIDNNWDEPYTRDTIEGLVECVDYLVEGEKLLDMLFAGKIQLNLEEQ